MAGETRDHNTIALNLATGALGRWNIDMGRYAREQMPPAEYLGTSYYEHWLYGLEKLVQERLLTGDKPERAFPTYRFPVASAISNISLAVSRSSAAHRSSSRSPRGASASRLFSPRGCAG